MQRKSKQTHSVTCMYEYRTSVQAKASHRAFLTVGKYRVIVIMIVYIEVYRILLMNQ